jgi:excinuclease ABC subunit A
MDKPDVDMIDGLSPAISIEQKSTSHNPRSTVGTITEVYDYLRLLFARAGTPTCPKHGEVLEAQTLSQMVDSVLAMKKGTALALLAPVVRDRKGDHATLLERLRAQGYLRARIDGVMASAMIWFSPHALPVANAAIQCRSLNPEHSLLIAHTVPVRGATVWD